MPRTKNEATTAFLDEGLSLPCGYLDSVFANNEVFWFASCILRLAQLTKTSIRSQNNNITSATVSKTLSHGLVGHIAFAIPVLTQCDSQWSRDQRQHWRGNSFHCRLRPNYVTVGNRTAPRSRLFSLPRDLWIMISYKPKASGLRWNAGGFRTSLFMELSYKSAILGPESRYRLAFRCSTLQGNYKLHIVTSAAPFYY
jgi:hypothetical protein